MQQILFIAFVLGLALAAPAKPQISDTFYAKVSVTVAEGRTNWRGGGLQAYDVPNGRARIDVRVEGSTGDRSMHVLDRYDLNETFTIDENNCVEHKATGKLDSPWAWVANSNFSGTSTYQGVPLDDWSFVETDGTVLRLSVLHSNANTPVFFSQRKSNGTVFLTEITYLEFNSSTPEEWVFYVPKNCQTGVSAGDIVGGDPSSVVYFANSQWDCADVSCSSRVPAGSGQPNYECAEFVARSLAYGGYFPGLSATASQATYLNWKGYDLCYTTHLADALTALAGFKKVASSGSAVVTAGAIFGNAGDGSFSHTCVGIAAGTVDCHNNAREKVSAAGEMYLGVDAVYAP